jgi:hypothetical protein
MRSQQSVYTAPATAGQNVQSSQLCTALLLCKHRCTNTLLPTLSWLLQSSPKSPSGASWLQAAAVA